MKRDKKILLIGLIAPIVLLLIFSCGSAMISSIKKIWPIIFPNLWVALVYIYIAVISFFAGRNTKGKKENSKSEE